MRERLHAVCCALVVALLLAAPATAAEENSGSEKADYYELMRVFVDSFEQIERNYVKDVDRRELVEAAIKGMIAKLDPYSDYISPEELNRFTEQVDQEFGGIGVQVQEEPETNRLMVVAPLPGTPAYKAGVQPGDVIMEIDGKSTDGFKLSDAVKILKGNPGEAVTLGVRRAGSDSIEQIKIVRDIIRVSTVLGDQHKPDRSWDFMMDHEKKIGYLRLTHFSRHTSEELRESLEALKKEGMKGLILDLRFNPGGLLNQATEVADLFIDEGKIVSTEGRNTPERVWEATKDGNSYTDVPMVILVNRYSASASEIVSACLQDHKRAIVVGERTWGKGSVQNVIELEEGSSALKLTTASYHRPSGKNIHRFPDSKETDEWGVMPDDGYKVEFSIDELQKYSEYRQKRDAGIGTPEETKFDDRQLAKALEYIRAQVDAPSTATTESAPEDKPKAEAPSTPPKDNTSSDALERIPLPRKAAA